MQREVTEFSRVTDIGSFSIATSDVVAANRYLTLVLAHGLPFDMAVSETEAQAIEAHDAFVLAAAMFAGG